MQVIETVAKLKKCLRPDPYAVLPLLKAEGHVASEENMRRLKINVANQEDHIVSLEATIDCYEVQGEQ